MTRTPVPFEVEFMFLRYMAPYIKWFKLSPMVHLHLVRVMTRMLKSYSQNTLVKLFSQAQTDDPKLQGKYLVELADRYLFVVGCFPESVAEDGLSFDWLFKMAKSAYMAAAQLDNTQDHERSLYNEMAHNTIECAWVMRETYIEIQLENLNDIKVIYDFFTRSQSMAAQRKLQQLGFHFSNGEDTEE